MALGAPAGPPPPKPPASVSLLIERTGSSSSQISLLLSTTCWENPSSPLNPVPPLHPAPRTSPSPPTPGCWGAPQGAGGAPQKAGGALRCVALQPHPDNISPRRRTGAPAAPRPVPLPQSLSLPFPRRCHLPAAQGCHRGCCVPWRGTLLSSLPGPLQPLRSPRAGLGSTPDIPQHQTQAPRPPSRDSQYLPVFPHDRQDLPGNPSAPPWLPGSSSDPRDSQFLRVSPNAPSTSQSPV